VSPIAERCRNGTLGVWLDAADVCRLRDPEGASMALQIQLPMVERLIGCRLSSVEEAELRGLIEREIAESDQLEFKGTVDGFLSTEDQRFKFANAVCALANARGGLGRSAVRRGG
jgi:hypothetical protein